MRSSKLASMIVAGSLVFAALAAAPAKAEDQRTSDQRKASVVFVSKVVNQLIDQKIAIIAKALGVKVSHPSAKVWKMKALPKQIQTFQRMLGGLGLTLKSRK